MGVKSQQRPQYLRLKASLRDLRKEAGLTQVQLAQRLKVPQSFVYKSKTGIRRVDLTEFVARSRACVQNPLTALRQFLAK